jgi:hypothetical protein
MSAVAHALTLDQLRSAIGPATLDDTIQDVATMASISLALLTLFTTRRSEVVAGVEKDLAGYTKGELRVGLAIDVLLTLITTAALAAMAPLLLDAFDGLRFLHEAGALRTIFAVVWFAFLGLVVYQLNLVSRSGSRVRAKGW